TIRTGSRSGSAAKSGVSPRPSAARCAGAPPSNPSSATSRRITAWAAGGNITGFITMEPTIAGKWLELLKEIAPRVARVALLFNPATVTYLAHATAPASRAAHGLPSKELFSSLSGSTGPHLPSQIAKSGPFANELNAEQYAKQPDRSYREAGPKIESDQY